MRTDLGGIYFHVIFTLGLISIAAAARWELPYFAVLQLHYHLGWQIHLWAGAVFLAVVSAVGLGLLAADCAESGV